VILQGHVLDVLPRLPEASVHCVVTSPPYWSLRDYSVPETEWGDGWRGCLGLEPTPDRYVAHLVEVFTEVHRVLRDDGTLWLNLGDCYAAGSRGGDVGGKSGLEGSKQGQEQSKLAGQRIGCRSSFRRDRLPRGDVAHKVAPGIKPKDLVGIPWTVAFALREAGWYLRCDVIWAKTNPMPESIKDRPTKSHEYLFLFAKSENYFYDADAIREGDSGQSAGNKTRKHRVDHGGNPRLKNAHQGFSVPWKAGGGRNRRSVWTLSTARFPGAHFATFPPRLVEPCILAGTSEYGCCSICGAPFLRIIQKGAELVEQKKVGGADRDGQYHGKARKAYDAAGAQDPSEVKKRILEGMRERITVGWKPTCRHTLREIEPCTVLDPFAGAGTTGLVADKHGRAFIGIELSEEYVAIGTTRRLAAVEASA
jgi:DNA modification methylase